MFGDHFYHAILRKSVAVFGTMFNDLYVVRKNNVGTVVDQQKVPLSYGPKQKFLARLDQQANLDDPKLAIKLPRMSFEITNMQYDSTTKISNLNRITTASTYDTKSTIGQITPYIVDMQLNIIAKNQDDALQILEQIIPYFQPTYTLSVKFIEDLNSSFDVPISLTAINMQDDYEGDYSTRRSLIYTLDFSMKVKFFGPKSQSGVITLVDVDLIDSNNFGFLEEMVTESSISIVQAVAQAFTGDYRVTYFNIVDRGRGYSTAPTITISAPTSSAETAQVTPVLTNGEITLFTINNPGNFYTGPADITIQGIDANGNFEITATGLVRAGKVYAVPLPTKTGIISIVSTTVSAPTGTAQDFIATATATITDEGRLDTLTITDGGGGYTANPTVTISAPSSSSAVYSVFQGVDNTDDGRIT